MGELQSDQSQETVIGCQRAYMHTAKMTLMVQPNATLSPIPECPQDCSGPVEEVVRQRFFLIGPKINRVVTICPLEENQG